MSLHKHALRSSARWALLPLLCAALALPAQAQSQAAGQAKAKTTKKAAPPSKARQAAKPTASSKKTTPARQAAGATAAGAAAAAATAASAPAPASTPKAAAAAVREADFIVAIVNSEPVTNHEVRTRMVRLQKQLAGQGASLPPEAQLRKDVMERLIAERAQLQHARETGLQVDDAALAQAELSIARQNQLATVQELHQRVQQEGLSVKEFQDDVRNQVLLARLREREIEPRLQITDTEVDNFIRQQTGARVGGQDVNMAMILVAVPEGASTEDTARLQARAAEAARRARAGEDFGALAREFSDANNRGADDGVLGLRPADKYPELFVRSIQRARVGDIVGPVKSDAGFHVLKLLERKQNNELPEVRIPQTHVRHILLTTGPGQSQQVVRERAEDLRRRILAGQARFEDLARQHSQDASAAEGGDLGWASPGQFVPEFEQAMNNLDPGQISPPITSRFGVHLIRVDDRRERTLSSAEQRQLARNMLREQKAQEAFDTWASEVRGRAYVEYRDAPK
ncbi:MAG: peptidylprolyl isomerase [Pseudomonadota bacterium]|nr:peptidylprolyl isomerase [Pseudomonadota bacterium]